MAIDEAKLDEAMRRLHADPRPVRVEMGKLELLVVLLNLQLALRHPKSNGIIGAMAREVAMTLTGTFDGDPAVAELIAEGWKNTPDLATAVVPRGDA